MKTNLNSEIVEIIDGDFPKDTFVIDFENNAEMVITVGFFISKKFTVYDDFKCMILLHKERGNPELIVKIEMNKGEKFISKMRREVYEAISEIIEKRDKRKIHKLF